MPQRDKWGRLVCTCGGYWFPHRKGGGACEHSPTRDIHMALRAKSPELLLDALISFAWDHPHKLQREGPCPF